MEKDTPGWSCEANQENGRKGGGGERGWEEKIFYSQSQQNKLQMRSLTPFVIQPSLEKISNPSSIRAVTRSLNKITPEL
ncbi:hypothetical protein HZH68_013843 [Vespula germanica]|uniref:Uncharacterized protein n=1 Tax=Vespula germanica TaxID=30212 RepID=A0A834MWA7_VESGE|nr:hypothetical protein HZH68_013843 [Vespula germanica]